MNALGGTISEASWRIKPSWYLVATDDKMIPPPAQRAIAERTGATVTEVPASHSVYLSQPEAAASLIKQAAGEHPPRAGARARRPRRVAVVWSGRG